MEQIKMRALLQRVSSAHVTVEGQRVGEIERGLLVLLGIHKDDTSTDGDWIAKKIPQARIFEDEAGKMNLSVGDIGGGLLVISQFTLFGNMSKGARPSFIDSMPGELAREFYTQWMRQLRSSCPLKIEEGRFAASMRVSLVNEGPVTLMLDSRER
jgi:D-tyrosyl-tRNA(Tyr) deacylase